jgi:hypothetical protein
MKIKIEHSLESEVDQVFNILKRISWYKEKGYKIILPLDINTDSTDKEYIRDLVSKEYNEEDYKKISDDLSNKLPNIDKIFSDVSIKPLEEYEVLITKYGVSGGYDLPNEIVVNVSSINSDGYVGTIIHEIIHLMIEGFIQQYKVGHWEKERIVDLIFSKILPGQGKEQNLSEKIDITEIDNIFNKLFPDIENIVKTVGEK